MNLAIKAATLLLLLLLDAVNLSDQGQGSTPQIKEIVIGRCYDHQYKKYGSDVSKWKDCETIWKALHSGFAYKNPCKLTSADYKPFFDEAGMPEIHDKGMFWSGTYEVVHDYSNSRFRTLEDTLAGHVVDGLTFCGNESLSPLNSDGIDYNSCPDWSENCGYTTAFWSLASTTFAEHARGIVRVMLNGSRVNNDGEWVPAYKRTSFFGTYELPNLQVDKISKLMILVIHTIHGKKYERCGRRSIKLLQSDARKRGIKVTCHDDPNDVKHILCADHPFSRECLFLKQVGLAFRIRAKKIRN